MLSPQSRRNLMEILRPDTGYVLDYAIGTSYSLDLLAALTVPLAFTLFGWQAEEEPTRADPVQLLDSLHRYANRLHLFCQAGQITLPPIKQRLLAYLEKTIVEVNPQQKNRVFHPKVWVLRFRATGEQSSDFAYRMLCLSRNLTFDHSWDTAMSLEGLARKNGQLVTRSQPLADFIAALPDLTVHPMRAEERRQVINLATQVRTVEFSPPDGFDDMTFYPLGISGRNEWPFDEPHERICVVSPFVAPKTLTRLTQRAKQSYLISQLSDLQNLNLDTLKRFTEIQVLNDTAQPEPEDNSGPPTDAEYRNELHAKLYIAESEQRAWLWTGSANATQAAFNGNVEFLIKLTGRTAKHGIDTFRGPGGIEALLLPYASQDQIPPDEQQQALEKILEIARAHLRSKPLTGKVSHIRDDEYQISLHAGQTVNLPHQVSVWCWPITFQESAGVALPSEIDAEAEAAHFISSFEGITTFFAVQLSIEASDHKAQVTFVLNIPLEGLPEDRNSRLLESILTDRQQVYRMLLLLLAEQIGFDPSLWAEQDGGGESARWAPRAGIPLFEAMLQALFRNPSSLDAVGSVVEQLMQTPRGQKLLPEEFELIWAPIWEVRQQLRQESHHEAH